jgi:hypothetical protein
MKISLLRPWFWIVCLVGVVTPFITGIVFAQSQPIFPVAPQVTLGADSTLVFAGDINGNGATDLAYYTWTNSGITLAIELNVGSASPTTVTTPLCSGSANQPAVRFGDLNKDKKLDLVYYCNGYLTIQLGNGDGTFQTPAYFPAVSALPVIVDLNGDGYPDIAALATTSTNGPTQISIYLNEGSGAPGTFGNPTSYASPNSIGLQSGDFNGDGKTDLLTTVYAPSSSSPTNYATSLAVFFGNGDGTVNPAKSQSTSAFSTFTTADFNGDGISDIALLPNQSGGNLYAAVQILLGSTSGNFTTGSSLPLLASILTTGGYYNYNSLNTATLTADGNLDLIVTTSVVTTFHGDGKGNFTQVATYAPGYPGSPTLFADTNGDGKPDMIVGNPTSALLYAGNGDGTFQAPPAIPVAGSFADVNNDGITDIVFQQPTAIGFGTALGRGDGTFAILNQTVALPTQAAAVFLAADVNGDGNVDTLAIQSGTSSPSSFACDDDTNSQLLVYLGNGKGTFQEKGTGLPLGVRDPAAGILGDFNSDGKLDVIVPYNTFCQVSLLFVPGNGDGTFGTPVLMNLSQSGANTAKLLAGDLNNDKKLDFIWGGAVFLGNGDGTFKQIPLSIQPSPVVALADLNGDGILDAVSTPGVAIYAGKGDGTFASTPFFNQASLNPNFFASGSVDGNTNPDLIPVGLSSLSNPSVLPYVGDGHGNFTADPNSYLVSLQQVNTLAAGPARLNNQAPPIGSNTANDMLVSVTDNTNYVYTVSLLNQLNPAPMKPAPVSGSVTLSASASPVNTGGTITFTATVVGTNPGGSVTFTANQNSLGTEPLVNGTAVLQTSFPNAGSYTVTASYAGDPNNAASTSSPVTVVVASPDFTIAATPATGSITAGQSATFGFSVTPMGGYSGTVQFSCANLPSQATCAFSPASVTPSGTTASTSTLTISTTASMHANSWLPTGGLALAGAMGFFLVPIRRKHFRQVSRIFGGVWLLALVALTLQGCGGGGSSMPSSTGTPAGNYTISVNASGGSGGPQHVATISLTVQ